LTVLTKGYRTTFLYDAAGNSTAKIDPLDRRTSYAYDGVGRQVLRLDPRGYRMTTVYDAAGRLTAELLGSGRRNTLSYDQASRRTVAADPTGIYTTTYDDRGQPLTVSQPGDKRITYAYDAVGRRARMTDPDGGRFTYAYDAAGRLAHLVNPQDERSTFAYDDAGRQIRQQLANGTLTTQVYDAANHLTDLLHAKSDGTVVSRSTYAYDPVGNRTGLLEADGSRTTWSYDNTYQLTAEHRTAGTSWESLTLDDWSDLTLSAWDMLPLGDPNATFRTTYTYDPAGNRLLMNDSGVRTTYSYDAANELLWEETPTGRTTYTHDATGNRTTKETTDGVTTYTWDEDNRLTAAQLPTAGCHTFAYNADGKRVTREDGSGTAKYIRDFNRILQQTDAAGDTERVYTAAPNDFGNLLSEHDGAASTYHHYDALGTTNALTDSAETPTDRYLHRAFGQLLSHDGQSTTPFLFVGREGYYYEPVLALHYVNARWYDPATGRWMSEDPIGYDADDANLRRYVSNWAMYCSDPSGLAHSPTSKVGQSGRWMPTFTLVAEPHVVHINRTGLTTPAEIKNYVSKSVLTQLSRGIKDVSFSDAPSVTGDYIMNPADTLGISGFVRAVRYEATLDKKDNCCTFSGSVVAFMAFTVILREKRINDVFTVPFTRDKIEGAETVLMHERWHTHGVPLDLSRYGGKLRTAFNKTMPDRGGYSAGARQAMNKLRNCLGFVRNVPKKQATAQSDEWCLAALKHCVKDTFLSKDRKVDAAIEDWIRQHGYYHDETGTKWNLDPLPAFPGKPTFEFPAPKPQ
jgi:RHS repeat-associated protein